VEEIVKAGLSSMMRSLLRQHVDNLENIPLNQLPPESRRFVNLLRKEAKKRGMDISKII
jgi:flagellar motor switch protein FliG